MVTASSTEYFCKGKWKREDITRWLHTYQITVNDLLNLEKLVFTTKTWLLTGKGVNKTTKITDTISVIESITFPFLAMELLWNPKGKLRFKAHMKPNQQLKYLNRGSCHTTKCFQEIPNGVFKRLSKLTSTIKQILESILNIMYPHHAEARRKADLAPDPSPRC